MKYFQLPENGSLVPKKLHYLCTSTSLLTIEYIYPGGEVSHGSLTDPPNRPEVAVTGGSAPGEVDVVWEEGSRGEQI